jgi:hypothetical protein
LVHYSSLGDRDGKYPSEVQAALITKVSQHTNFNAEYVKSEEDKYHVSLHVFYEDGGFNMKQVPFTLAKAGSEEARGKWCWPERI